MFDLILALVLLVSAAVGFFRGATMELVSVLAFIAAVVLAILSLPVTAPLFSGFIGAAWIARAAAMLVTFLVVYVILRVLGSSITRRVHATSLGAVDRAVGLGFGLIRGLVILGVFNLVFHAATPPERTPAWVTEAKLYPLTAFCGRVLKALAPQGSALMGKVTPALEKSLKDSGETPPESNGDKSARSGYDARDRRALDDLVEKSL